MQCAKNYDLIDLIVIKFIMQALYNYKYNLTIDKIERIMSIQDTIQFQKVSYRNGIYQGHFDTEKNNRHGYGLAFSTDNHMIMGSHWIEDQANDETFIFTDHSSYIYGFWQNSIPNGFNAVRMQKIVVYAWYQMGIIKGRILLVYEQYNTAIVLEKGQRDDDFFQIQKGDLYSDDDMNQYIKVCNWPQFQQNWKSLIKFITGNLIKEEGPKQQRAKLRLINQIFFRYGFEEGIAIVFDDQYKIISAGLHKKANLESLGIRFTKQNFVEQGNFTNQNQVIAFNYGKRPENKMGKIYTNYLLTSPNFVNKFITNPANGLTRYLEELIRSNLFRKLLAGQITSRKLDLIYGNPETNRSQKGNEKYAKVERQDLKTEKKESGKYKGQTKNKADTNHKQDVNNLKARYDELKKLKEDKERLDAYKKQVYDSIRKKEQEKDKEKYGIYRQNPDQFQFQPQNFPVDTNQIIHKPPVELATRNNRNNQSTQNKYNRNPIFLTPEKNQSGSASPNKVSPFKQVMKEKTNFEKKRNKYLNNLKKEEQLYPKHSEKNQEYRSPHQDLRFTKSPRKQWSQNNQITPISVVDERKKQSLRREQQKERDRNSQLNQNEGDPARNQRLTTPKKKTNQGYFEKIQQTPVKRLETNQSLVSFRQSKNPEENKRINNPNILINPPYQKKSPYKKQILLPDEAELQAKKNNIYLKDQQDKSPKKDIKGNTYLQKYNITKNKTPEKGYNDLDETRRYNKAIKSFNQNNRVYEKIQSPPKFAKQQPKQAKLKEQRKGKIEYYQNSNYNPGREPYMGQNKTPNKRKYQYLFN